MPRKWKGKGVRKTAIAMGDCINGDLQTVRDECRKGIPDRRNWTLLIDNAMTEQ